MSAFGGFLVCVFPRSDIFHAVMVMRVFRYRATKILDIIPTYIKELDIIDKIKITIENGKKNLVYVSYVKSMYKILATYILENKFVALFAHMSFVRWGMLRLQLMAFSYVTVAAKTTNLEDLRHSNKICI